VKLHQRIHDAYKKLLRNKQPIILDLGANIGLASIYYSKIDPEAKIISVELDLENFQAAKSNLAKYKNVEVIHAAVSSEDGKGYRSDPGLGNNAYRLTLSADQGDKEVETVSVRSLLKAVEASEVLLAKIDIEGSERELFAKNTEWVSKTEIIVMETHDWLLPGLAASKSFISSISGLDRDFLHRGENVYSIANH
jgi:FkbM family methyltransferase